MGYVKPPPPSDAEATAGLDAVIEEAHRYGVTCSSEIIDGSLLPVWQAYASRPSRSFRAALFFRAPNPETVAEVKRIPEVPHWLMPRGVKLFMDGSLGSRSAYMATPFTTPLPTQPAGWRGIEKPGAKDGTYRRIIDAAAAANIQVIVHAIGDQANHDILDLFAATPEIEHRRFRIEHAQHLLPDDIPRFGQLGVIASMQPYHKSDDGRYCEEVIGTPRSMTSYAYADLRRTGARLAFGSDFDVVTINPWVGMATAVTGRISTGKVWMPHENIPLGAALDAYTRGGAFAMFMEDDLGRLAPDYRADFLILDRNPKPDGSDLGLVHPSAVYVEGKAVRISPARS
jgi:predicted amidohydrolase YtcJ